MQCTSPRTVGFNSDGKTLCWSSKHYSKEFATFQIACGKCLACRLQKARETAVRCVHEASMFERNCFVTLTYSDDHIGDGRLDYSHFQKFVKDVRNHRFQGLLDSLFPNVVQEAQRKLWRSLPKSRRDELYRGIKMSVLVTGEYGDKTKRPHWHAIFFNWRPYDLLLLRTNELGDKIYRSDLVDRIWGRNDSSVKPNEIGDVTFRSAGYVARYATKKLVHGKDGEHDFEPVSRRSSANAIGKTWLEVFWRDVFNNGFVILPDGVRCGVPRYYERWLKKTHPARWEVYVTQVKAKIVEEAIDKETRTSLEERKINLRRSGLKGLQISREQTRKKLLKRKYDEVSKFNKL